MYSRKKSVNFEKLQEEMTPSFSPKTNKYSKQIESTLSPRMLSRDSSAKKEMQSPQTSTKKKRNDQENYIKEPKTERIKSSMNSKGA